jgi:mono/diheme cytochrome c family protein
MSALRSFIAFLMLPPVLGLTARGAAGDGVEFFEKKIRPLLVEHCYQCHSRDSEKLKGGLLLDSRDGVLKGGETGPAIVPGDPEKSLLIKAVRYLDKELQMPPKDKKLSDAQIADLVAWVKMGAPDPRITDARNEGPVTAKAKTWWAFQPVQKPAVPGTDQRNPIDAFINAKLAAAQVKAAQTADRRTLLRRVTFDLTGLPPAPEAVAAFLADDSPGAFARVVDRLLSSPTYGQRWARHWLDVVRYADYHDANPKERTASCEPLEAWRYRDWVVESFNRDLPFDQFITHQIAGDLLPGPSGETNYLDGAIATTFLANGAWDRGDADKEKLVSDIVDDQIDTVGKAFLGLTLGCARCHDHKYDPVSTEDYYALAGIFYSTHVLQNLGAKDGEITLNRLPLVPRAEVAHREGLVLLLADVRARLRAYDKQSPPVATNHPERLRLVKERDALVAELPPPPLAVMTAQEFGMPGGLFPNIQDVPIHIRGSYTKLGPVVPRRMPAFLVGTNQPPIAQGSGRRELAAWIASPANPLTARVIVNRVWQWHFSEGLVRTPNNFGLLSEPPSHPELLDWLANQFIADGWSLKKLHRRILLSTTYQRAAGIPRDQLALDPDNRWLGRYTARRLEAEAIRDAMIFVTGQLDLSSSGPAVTNVNAFCRSLYVQTARWDRGTFAALFDAANPDDSVEKRTISTVAPQALLMLNSDFVQAQAMELAKRLLREALDETARIQRAYQLLFGRQAKAEELDVARQLLAKSGSPREIISSGTDSANPQALSRGEPETESAWRDLAHVLLCTNEFVYVD